MNRPKKVRVVFNNLSTEEFLLLHVVYSPLNGMVGICERLHDGFGMNGKKFEDLKKEKEIENNHYKGKIIEVPITNLMVINESLETNKQ